MTDQNHFRITAAVVLPAAELSFSYSRSSGKGGQHVNKVNTKVSLHFDLAASQSLTDEQKTLIQQRLAGRINNQGVLRLDNDRQRSQRGNQEEVIRRFISLLQAALHVRKSRRRTRPSRKARQRRLQTKKQRSQLKRQRTQRDFEKE
ncbi:MAG: alternative ribosome rescue aminoacyl-tRNA hydrolase ArfB [Candidatus Electrothrix sp. YB6]